ncbi:MAG: peptidoglycan-binding protein [Syntrophomonas sp.]
MRKVVGLGLIMILLALSICACQGGNTEKPDEPDKSVAGKQDSQNTDKPQANIEADGNSTDANPESNGDMEQQSKQEPQTQADETFPSGTAIADEPYTPVSIHLLTTEEMESIVDQLIKLGYLNEKPASEKEFGDALRKFQTDNKLASSGEIDADTLKAINNSGK